MQPAYTATPVTRGLYRDQLLALADCARTDLRNRHGIGLLILLPKNLPKRANLDVVWEVLTSQLSAYQFEWGGKGGAPGQLSLPHSIVLDGAGRVYVANRGNARIQIFTGGGTFISQIKTGGGSHSRSRFPRTAACSSPMAATNPSHRSRHTAHAWWSYILRAISLMSSAATAPRTASTSQFILPHDIEVGIEVGADGCVYAADVVGGRIQKFEPRKP